MHCMPRQPMRRSSRHLAQLRWRFTVPATAQHQGWPPTFRTRLVSQQEQMTARPYDAGGVGTHSFRAGGEIEYFERRLASILVGVEKLDPFGLAPVLPIRADASLCILDQSL